MAWSTLTNYPTNNVDMGLDSSYQCSHSNIMNPLIVHCKREPYDIYIGRPSIWGNPFEIGKDGTRTEVIQKYEDWIRTQPKLMAAAKRLLVGRTLGCWCSPLPCHGEVLIKIANE